MKADIKRIINDYILLKEDNNDDRPDNWRELPGYNPDYFYDEEWEKLKDDGDDEEPWLERMKRKLSGVDDEQAVYNKEHGLPPTWRGSKEGYHEYITKKTFPSGSNE